MGAEMAAAAGAYDDGAALVFALACIGWFVIGALIMRADQSEDMEKDHK